MTIAVIIVVATILFLILITVLWYISALNKLRRMDVKCDEALSGIDVALTKRYDTLTKMIDVTKAYTKYENETLKAIVALRKPTANSSIEDKMAYADKITSAIKELEVVVENYPDLKANSQYTHLQVAIQDTEEHLQAARRLYNANVSLINQKIVSFPSSIVAGNANIRKRVFFEAEEIKRQDVEMNF